MIGVTGEFSDLWQGKELAQRDRPRPPVFL
jgi:hypothetical protein